MRLLLWQWGRRGAGPRFAAELAAGFRALPDTQALLSLSAQAELLHGAEAPPCELPFATYDNLAGAARRMMLFPLLSRRLAARLRPLKLDLGLCVMPAALDLLMAEALRLAGVPYAMVVHDADIHPGEAWAVQIALARQMARNAVALVALSDHVARRLRELGLAGRKKLIMTRHPPFAFGPVPPPPLAHGGKLRLLSFGRLLPYKGLDLLAEALSLLGPRDDVEIRVAGSGPESAALAALRLMPNVTVENRWVPEAEVAALIGWADALVLSHREASQSGVAAAAVAARRWLVATRVGGLAEQLRDETLAWLCEPDAASLAAALRRLIVSPPPVQEAIDPAAAWQTEAALLRTALAELS